MKDTTYLIIIALAFFGGFVWGCNAHNCTPCPEVKADTSTKVKREVQRGVPTLAKETHLADYTEAITSQKSVHKSKPFTVREQRTDEQVPNSVTKEDYFVPNPCEDYFVTREYADTAHFENADVYVNNTVAGNKIIDQQITADVKERTVYKTIERAPKLRNQVYFGMGGAWNAGTLSIGPSLMLVTKRQRVYEVYSQLGTDGNLMYGVSSKFKIKLK